MHALFCRRSSSARFGVCAVVISTALITPRLCAQESLHHRIDQTLASSAVGPVAGSVDDLTFARRIYLDLIGRIPSSVESRQFLANTSDDRRTQLVDQLLASKHFTRHLAIRFDLMLMERRGGKHVKPDDLRAWLQQSFEQNKPFHQLAGELIAADVSGGSQAPAAFFLERDVEPNLMTREVARVFFGMDLQCAQCHDHPNVDDYKQEDYYGLHAFVSRSTLFKPDKKKPAVVAESADGQSPFKSVFTNREAFTAPRMPGEAEFTEPVFAAGDEYKVRPSKTVAGVPEYSRRAKLAEFIATGQNDSFRRNIANRLWAMVMGRGLVHPVDMHHSMNPPSHPELMSLLADELAAMQFDVKAFIRELVLTDVYQRSHRFDEEPSVEPDALAAKIDLLAERKQTASIASTTKEAVAQTALSALDEAIAKAEPVRAAWTKAHVAAVAAANKRADTATTQQGKQTVTSEKQALAENLSDALARTTNAAQFLGNPKDLAAISITLKTRADKTNSEIQKLEKELAAATNAAKAAADVLAKAQTADAAERNKLLPLKETMRKHRAVMVTAWKDSQEVYEQVTDADQKIELLEQIIIRTKLDTQIPVLQTDIANVVNRRTTAEKAMADAAKQQKALTQELTAVNLKLKESDQAAKELSQQMQMVQQVSNTLAEAVVNAKSAAATLSQDRAIADAASQLENSSVRIHGLVGEKLSRLDSVKSEIETMSQLIAALQTKAATASQQVAAAKTVTDDSKQKLADLQQQLTASESGLDAAAATITDQSAQQFHLANVTALTPEQLAWSVLQATGQIQRQTRSELAKINKETPLKEAQKTAAAIEQRNGDAEAAAVVSLTRTVASFVALFAAQKGQPQDDFFATVDQALFFTNGSQMRGWLSPSGDNLTGRLVKLESAPELAEELYLSTLVRKPTAEEVQDVTEYLQARGKEKSAAVRELSWALITSAEFRFQ